MSNLLKLILVSSLLVSCSFFKSKPKVEEPAQDITLTDAEDFGQDPTLTEPTAVDPLVEAPVQEAAIETPTEVTLAEEPAMESAAPVVEATEPVVSEEKIYTVKKNETLMMVAFNIYGDYDKWREVAQNNQDVLAGGYKIREGMKLKYMAPAQEFVWNPEGNPYLIKHGDTLGGISHQVYNNRNKWRSIWENNKPLIKNPNRIFAGFTIYYLDLDKVASF